MYYHHSLYLEADPGIDLRIIFECRIHIMLIVYMLVDANTHDTHRLYKAIII